MKIIRTFTVLLLVLWILAAGAATSTDLLNEQLTSLISEKARLETELKEVKKASYDNQLSLIKSLELTRLKLANLFREKAQVLREKGRLESSQQLLIKGMSTTHLPSQHELKRQKVIKENLNKSSGILVILIVNERLLLDIEQLQSDTLTKLKISEEKKKRQQTIKAIHEEITSHQKSIFDELQNKIQLESAKDRTDNGIENEANLSLSSLSVSLHQLAIEKLQLQILVFHSPFVPAKSQSAQTLDRVIAELEAIKQRLTEASELQQVINQSIQKQKELWITFYKNRMLPYASLQKLNDSLKSFELENKSIAKSLIELLVDVSAKLSVYQKEKLHVVGMRQGLFTTSADEWLKISYEVSKLPQALGVYTYSLYLRVKAFISALPVFQQWGVALGILIVSGLWFFGKRGFEHLIERNKGFRLGKDLFHVLTRLLKRNWGGGCIVFSLCLLFYLANLTLVSYRLVVMLFLVWFIFRGVIGVTRLTLLESHSNVDGHDVILYHRLKLTFVIGGFITACMAISNQLNMDHLVTDLFSRLFMLFTFTVSIILYRGRTIIVTLLTESLRPKKVYIKRAIYLFAYLVPLTILVNAVVGLLGFMNLAWAMGYYQVVVVLLILGFVVARGILNDAMTLIAELMINRLRNGWLWSEVFLKPAHRILKIGLILLFVVLLFNAYGFGKSSAPVQFLISAQNYHIFSFSGGNITIASFIEFVILLALFIWVSKWTRECCYRWLYRNVRDISIRNSFSVFTQYAVITVGAFITLRVLGVDISGMSVILGGLAVGLGFGLRDFANNIIGGLMLLIERPVKKGDLISLENFEGRVTHIGIRSMRVRSWDHLEVLIPNSETFNKPFTNWTHQDSVVRTVVTIKVSRDDSAVKIQQLILEVLAIIPEVLKDPAPQVYLKEIDEALLEFEVRYFINIEENPRVKVRSTVLFAITAQFKAAGIKAPIPPIQIEQHDSP